MKRRVLLSCLVLVCGTFISMHSQDEGKVDAVPDVQPVLKGHTMVNIGLNDATRSKIAVMLHELLANEYVLYVKTQKFHWNVKGPFFGPLHSFFQGQYEMLAEFVDAVAERSLALGIPSTGTLKEFLTMTTLQEEPGLNPTSKAMLTQLLGDHETVIQQLRAGIELTVEHNDMGTNNFLCDLLEKHEKMAWMLRAHIQEDK